MRTKEPGKTTLLLLFCLIVASLSWPSESGAIVKPPFSEGFEGYTQGQPPALPWETPVGRHGAITGQQAHLGSRSLGLSGGPSSSQSEYIDLGENFPDTIGFQAWIRVSDGGATGFIGFLQQVQDVLTRYNGVIFDKNGEIAFLGSEQTVLKNGYGFGVWHKIQVDLDFKNFKAMVWVNDELVGRDLAIMPRNNTYQATSFNLRYLGFVHLDGPAEIEADDFSVFQKSEKIVFAAERTGNPDIWIMDPDGTNPLQLTNDPGLDGQPMISPDGTLVAFISDRTGNYEIWVMDVDGKNQRQLTSGAVDCLKPVWSPVGNKIYYARYASGSAWDLWAVSRDGSNNAAQGLQGINHGDYAINHDGTRVCYLGPTNPDPNSYDLYVANINGSNAVNVSSLAGLTGFETPSGNASWSREGKILLSAQEPYWLGGVDYDIYWVKDDGTAFGVVLEEMDTRCRAASWSPDGSNIVFESIRSGNESIWTIDKNGQNVRQIVTDSAKAYSPHWGSVAVLSANLVPRIWQETSPLDIPIDNQGAAFVENGYIYSPGGWGIESRGTFHYARINPDGTLGTWHQTTRMPNSLHTQNSATSYNGVVYLVGGHQPNWWTSNVYYGVPGPDGAISSWGTATSLPAAKGQSGIFAYGGYLFSTGGTNAYSGGLNALSEVLYAPINPDGSIGNWVQATPLPQGRCLHGATAYNGYAYIVGGRYAGPSATAVEVLYAPFSTAPTVDFRPWTLTSSLPSFEGESLVGCKIFALDGYLYLLKMRGTNYRAPINTNGTLGDWEPWFTIAKVADDIVGSYTMNPQTKTFYGMGGFIGNGTVVSNKVYYISAAEAQGNAPNIPSSPQPAHTATSVSDQSQLSWSGGDPDPGDTVTYDVYFGTTLPLQKAAADLSSASYNPGNLSFSTTYLWKIVAQDSAGNLTAGPIWQFTTMAQPDSDPPSVPPNMKPSTSAQTWSKEVIISISWQAASDSGSGVAGYSFVWDTNPTTIPDGVVETGGLISTSSALPDGNEHYFHLRTVDNAGNMSAVVHLGPFYIDTVAPAVPANPASSSHSTGVCSADKTIDVSWTAPGGGASGIQGYSVLWDNQPNTLPGQIVNAVEANTTSPDLPDGASHYVHVRAVDGAGNWGATAVHFGPFCIAASVPAPKGQTAVSTGGGRVFLKWEDATYTSGVTGYSVYRSDSENGFYIQVNPVVSNEVIFEGGKLWQVYEDTSLVNGITYWYKVAAFSANGRESSPSSPVSAVPSPRLGGDFRIEAAVPSFVMVRGEGVSVPITVVGEDKFSEEVSLVVTSPNLPLGVTKSFTHPEVQPTGSTFLNLTVPYNTPTGDYSLKIDGNSNSRSHEIWLSLRIVDTGESVVTSFPTNEQIRIRETAEIIGQLVPFQPPGTEVTVSVKLPNTSNWITYAAQTDDTGWYEFSYLPEGGLGEYKVKAAWAGTYYLPACESEEAIFVVGKGKSTLRCSTDTQKVEPGTTVAIKIQLQPPLPGAVFNLEIWKPGQEAPVKVTGLTTQADGARTFYYELDKDRPGEWKFKASWAGNESHTGAISIPLVLYPGVDVGEALIVAGGGIENNTLWPTIENLANRFYMVLKSRRFNHDQIFYISPRVYSYDLNGDGKFEIVIDDHPPSKEKIQNYLLSLYREGVQAKVNEYRPLIIYLVDHGGTEKFKLNIGGEYLLAQEFDGWLDVLQAATNCEVVVIVEACHSGTFIEKLAPTGAQKRILISSSNTEVSNYDQGGLQSFTQYFLNQVSQGDNLRNCYHKTRDKLSNLRLFENQDPQLNDGRQGARAAAFYIGGTFLTGDIMPEITAITPNQVIQSGSFPFFVSVADAEGIAKVWVSVMPPNFIIPQPTNEFETPVVSLEKIDLADSNGDDIYDGNYNFQYNGMYVLTFFVQDIGDNVVSQEVRLTVENGQATFVPGDLNNDRRVDLLDAIVGLQVAVGMKPSVVNKGADVNGDGKIGMAEVIYILQKAATLR